MDPQDRMIVALDVPTLGEADAIAARLEGIVRWYKVGVQLFSSAGPEAVRRLCERGHVFLDLKFHDIPSVVEKAVEAAAGLGAHLLTVHTLGGTAMLRAALEAARRTAPERLRLLGVTLLTSADEETLRELGISGSTGEVVTRLARLALETGLPGVVTSPREARLVRMVCGPRFLIVCPGVRPEGSAPGDQRRVHTPREALAAGADMIVVGRPITHASDPRSAAEVIVREIASL